MAWIDAARGLLVLRIVYDGPPMSGKTTSLAALGVGMAKTVHCPEERDGRTLYFDWLEYVGGLFEGRQIRCQIVSVPGQEELAQRRRFLLESADAVVCVLDSTRAELDFGASWLRDLSEHCRARTPPVGIVLQANKRDVPDAVPRLELSNKLNAISPVAIVEAVATAADGIREAFVLAVRLALDRVRASAAEGGVRDGAASADDPAALLQAMQAAELADETCWPPARATALLALDHDSRMVALDAAPAQLDADPAAMEAGELQFAPDPAMPGGMIWPPVDGRALLHEVAALAIQPKRTPRGDFWGSGSGWCFHSTPGGLFDDLTAAREALIRWARLHAACANHISAGRVVILADAGRGRLRLWQLVRLESALRERLASVVALPEPQLVAHGVLEVAERLLAARERFLQTGANLPCTLWTVGGAEHTQPTFVGLMPNPDRAVSDASARALLEREIAPQLIALRRARVDFAEIVRELHARCAHRAVDAAAVELREVFERVA